MNQLKIWWRKRRMRKAYQHIVDYPADCGHQMLRVMRPDLYSALKRQWVRLLEVDPDCPEMPVWLK